MCTEGVIVVLRHQVQYVYKRGRVYSHFMPINGVGEEKVFDLLRNLPLGQPQSTSNIDFNPPHLGRSV